MITPSFTCSQTDTTVTVCMYTPSVRASDVEIHVDDRLFSVFINPYFLRLLLPGAVQEDDSSSAQYDAATGYLKVVLAKQTPGEEFKDLDILSKLLAPLRTEPPPGPIIEVLDSEPSHELDNDETDLVNATQNLTLEQQEILHAAENNWQLLQEVPEPLKLPFTTEQRYGFLDMHSGYFRHVAHTENEVNELGGDAETLPQSQRRVRRVEHEEQKWDEDYYMGDFIEDSMITELLAFEFPAKAPACQSAEATIEFTEEENMTMLRLPRKEYLTSPKQLHSLYLTLITILFSYSYDARTTMYDPTIESAWTISSLTPAFSALDPPPYNDPPEPLTFTEEDLQTALVPSFRRSLAFPLYRSYALSSTCISDVSTIMRRGRRAVLRALLETKYILDHHEVYYVYSKVWVDDFCAWVARDASEEILMDIGRKLHGLTIKKESTGWGLLALEQAALAQIGRESDSDDEFVDE